MTAAVPAPSAIAPAATRIHHHRATPECDALSAFWLSSAAYTFCRGCASSLASGFVDALCSAEGLASALPVPTALPPEAPLPEAKTCPPVKRSTALTRPSGLVDREGAALEDATVEVPGAGGFCAAGELAGESTGA